MDTPTNPRFQSSEGTYLYLLGLVIIATQPDRFWLGITLASVPLVVGIAWKTISRNL